MRTNRHYKVFLSFMMLLIVCAPSPGWAAPTALRETPATVELDPNHSEAALARPWDLRRFFEMEDPNAAADALREHARIHGIPLDATEQSWRTQVLGRGPNKAGPKTPETLIHVFNGTEFTPAPGVEDTLLVRAHQMVVESKAEEKIVSIVQLKGEMTIGIAVELLEAGVKVYEPVGRKAIIARIPASAITQLHRRPYIRWIGEYKPEYKYKKLGALIYILGSDREEYRADLKWLGIKIRRYDFTLNGYEVILNDVAISKVAKTLWWVKGINIIRNNEEEANVREEQHSRQIYIRIYRTISPQTICDTTKGNGQAGQVQLYCNNVVYSSLSFLLENKNSVYCLGKNRCA